MTRICAALLGPEQARSVPVLGLVFLGALFAPQPCAAVDDREREVHAAIERAVNFLYNRLEKGIPMGRVGKGYPLGIRALPAYALLEGGASPDSPLIRRLFGEMEAEPLERVYSVAIYVMALDALARNAIANADGGDPDKGGRIGASLRSRLERLLGWLVNARSIPRGVWGYEFIGENKPFEWLDFSNTQFAVLALQVGLRNDIRLPTAVLKEIAAAHKRCAIVRADGPGEVHCQGGGWWTDSEKAPANESRTGVRDRSPPVRFDAGGFTLRAPPIEWGYRPDWARSDPMAGNARYSMTAAGTSSLMVLREGLARIDALESEERDALDRLIAGGLISLRRGMPSLTPVVMGTLYSNYYYDIYSMEKAMDLGGIVEIDGIDWYWEQANQLLAAQRTDGGWGVRSGVDPEEDVVNTSFAILFLRRATRHMRITPVTPVVTGGGAPERGVRDGKVLLPSLNGIVELEELFRHLAEERSGKYLALATEVVETVPPDDIPELIPYLQRVRNGTGDSVDRFARKQIAAITGLPPDVDSAPVDEWLETWRRLRLWGGSRDAARTAEVAGLVRAAGTPAPLRIAAIEALVRIGSLDGVPALLEALASAQADVRDRAGRALELLTLHEERFDAKGSDSARADGAAAWRRWWEANEAELRFAREWARLRRALDAARDPAARTALRAEIIALGPRVLPKLEEIFAPGRFAFDWILVRDGLTGERRGV